MTHFQKAKPYLARHWISFSFFLQNPHKLPQPSIIGLRQAETKLQTFRFYGRKVVPSTNKCNGGMTLKAILQDAQTAFVEYLHSTRGLSFTDADHISRYSPLFLKKLLAKAVDSDDEDRAKSLARFLRYHHINEFEPFFESIGLKRSEYRALLPRGFMSLSEDPLMMENYHILCNYGVPRDEIGRIYKQAREVFRYGNGVLFGKLMYLEGLGISHFDVIKTIGSHPLLLTGNECKEFGSVLVKMRSLGFQCSWLRESLADNKIRIYNWRPVHVLLCLLGDLGFNNKEIENLIRVRPGLVFEGSGGFAMSLIGFRLKLGSSGEDVRCMLSKFPEFEASKFVANLKAAFVFLKEMEMEPRDIKNIIFVHHSWLGLEPLKKAVTIRMELRADRKRACSIIKENPLVLKSWVRGARVEELPSNGAEEMLLKQKIEFLASLGFPKCSEKMTNALKDFRGKGDELQDRFDCLVKAGFDPEDVKNMVKSAPKILNQSKETILAKIEYLVNELRYPLSDLLSFPSYIAYTTDRVRIRHSMYKWLTEQGVAQPNLALSTLIASSEKRFLKTYVNCHPQGPVIWNELSKKIHHQ